MSLIRVGNAPCSWGTLEFEGQGGERLGYVQVLDEMAQTGYAGTELGDWGFMPTEPGALREALAIRGLSLLGAFVPVALRYAERHAEGEQRALRTARLLADATHDADYRPLLILADDNGTDPVRSRNAGRVTPDMSLTTAEWTTFVTGAGRIGRAVREGTGLRTAFHHHCAGYVETPDEIERFLNLADPDLVGLVFDTGHYAFGAGDAGAVAQGLMRFAERIDTVHLKDCEPRVAVRSREEGWDYFESVRQGVFCELGQGAVDFPAVLQWLRERDYCGWVVVEQDVLPGMGTPRASALRNREYLRRLGV